MASTFNIHTTTNANALRYPGNRRVDRQTSTGHLFYISWSGNSYQVYRSINNGVSWAAYGSSRTAEATIQEMGSLHVDWQNRLYFAYRTSVSSNDRVWMQAAVITTSAPSWHTALLVASVANGGVAGSALSGMAPGVVRHSDGRTTGFVAVGYQAGTQMGVTAYGFTIAAVGQPVLKTGVIATKRSWQFTQAAGGHQAPSVIYEYSPAHMWITWGRTYLHCVKMTWNGSGWNGPTQAFRLSYFGAGTPAPPAVDAVSSVWRNPGLLVCQPYQYDTTLVVVFERNQANTRTTPYLTPVHPAGVVRNCAVAWNNVTRDFRVWAVGTSSSLLYYVDYIQATGTWSGWSTVSATAVAGATPDNWNVRRESFQSAKYDVLYENGGASPWNVTHVSQDLTYAPFAPRWQFGQGGDNMPANGVAWDTARSLDLRWLFTDPDTADVQTAWAISRQIGAGTIQYLRASDSTWQLTEQKNLSGSGLRTLVFGWGAASDANHTYKVKVWDSSDTASVYSDGLTVVPSTPVTPTITAPAVDGQVITTDEVDLEWTVAEQTAYRVRVRILAEVLYDSGWISGNADQFHIPHTMSDGFNYSLEVSTRNNEGLESAFVQRVIACDIFAPPDPTLTIVALPDIGAIRVTINNPLPPIANPNPGFNTNTTGWSGLGGTLTWTASNPNLTPGAARLVPSGVAAASYVETAAILSGAPGETFTVWGWIRPDTANKPVFAQLVWFNGAVVTTTVSVELPATAGQYQELVLQGTMPAGSNGVKASVGVRLTPAAGDAFTADDVWLMRGAQPKVRHNTIVRRKEFSIFDTSTMVEVADAVEVNGVYDDGTARSLYPYEYRVLARGDNGTTSYSAWVQ